MFITPCGTCLYREVLKDVRVKFITMIVVCTVATDQGWLLLKVQRLTK